MEFDEILTQVLELLQRQGRISYGALKRRFHLDDEYLQDLKDEMIDAQRVARDEDGKVLVWTGGTTVASSQLPVASLQPPAPSTQPSDALRPTLHALRAEAERRQLTVMFCDIVGSTTLSAQLDPEEYREVVRTYHETCAGAIHRYGGHTAQHLGDGLLVYFGYPTAHEDEAQRAVRAGLEIVGAIRGQVTGDGGQAGRKPLQVRIGIHTGLVVIGEIGSSEKREILAMGETPNLAARIQGQANPDEVVISMATYRLVEGLFKCEDRGQPELKGITAPLTLYRVVKEEEAQSRFQVVVRKGLTPLVGREHELGLLRERWERVKNGEGQVMLLNGEPGIGKSRLVQTLKEQVSAEGAICIEFLCSAYHQNSALYPVIEYLQRILQFTHDDSSEQKLDKLEQVLSRSRLDLQETVPFFASLLSLPAPRYTLPTFSPQKQKEKTYEALIAWLGEAAQHQAVCYAWEDLHWADPSTLELLTLFLNQVPTTWLLAVLTYRPEFTPPWGSHSYLSQMTLNRLGRAHVEAMVEQVTGGKILPKEVVQQIVSKTDGVPLFVEELTKTVLESIESIGSIESVGSVIPATLHDSLMARLDRLGMAKEVAQLGATLGREFNYELLRAVSPLDEEPLQQRLRQLVEAELVYQSGVPPRARYLFKHALVQDTAYQSLLKSRRQQLHQQIAQVLVKRFPETVEIQPELLAHHYTEAGLTEQAIPYWQKAGQRASQRSANVEAIGHLTKGLELLKALPDTPERAQSELTLQIALGAPLVATKGWAAPEVGRTCARARELCQQVGETSQLFRVLRGLWSFYVVRAELQAARELGEQLLTLAHNVQDLSCLLEAHLALGATLVRLGEFALACEHFKQGLALYDPQKHSSHAFLYGQDPGMVCLSYAAYALWYLGYPDQALRSSHEAIALAQETSLPFGVAYALDHAAQLHQFRREEQVAQEQTEVVIALSTEHGFPVYLARGTLLRGWALTEQERGEEGVKQIHRGLIALRATGTKVEQTHYLSLLAEAHGQIGQSEEGGIALAEALAAVHETGEREYEAELYRLKGTLTLQSKVQGPKSKVEEEAEACFHKAIDIARKQQAKSLELRATTSLARLWQQQGKQKEAHEMLAAIYGWFTEGFDTKDLQEAKVLLDELA